MRYFLTACALTLATPAFAEPTCLPRTELANALAERYAEQGRFIGITSAGLMFEVWVSAGGTFTVLVTAPDGLTCIAAAGVGGNVLPVEPAGVDG